MVLDTDYSVSSVRVARPETEVRGVRSSSSGAVGGVACSGHHGASYGGSGGGGYSVGGGSQFGAGGGGGSPSRTVAASSYSSQSYSKTSKNLGKSVGFGSGSCLQIAEFLGHSRTF